MSQKKRIDKNLALAADFNEYMLTHAKFMDSLPPKVVIFFEDSKDPILTMENLRTAKSHQSRTRGFKQVIASKHGSRWKVRPLAEVEAK